MIALGCDPDTHHAGLALVEYIPILRQSPKVLWTGLAFSPGALKSYAAASALVWPTPSLPHDLFVVEGQKIYPHSPVAPKDLITLGFAAGCAMGVYGGGGALPCYVPLPHEWKGTVPKEIAHSRILSRCIVVPEAAGLVHGSHGSHVIDAIGLALWGLGLPGAIQQGRVTA